MVLMFISSIDNAYMNSGFKVPRAVTSTRITIQGKGNTGEVYGNGKGFLLDMFNMWLVKNGISNPLSIPCL